MDLLPLPTSDQVKIIFFKLLILFKVNHPSFCYSLAPGVDMSPLMTWGSIEDTPLQVDDVMTTPGPQFKLPKISRREEIGLKLSEKASKASSEKRKAALQHATSSILKSR